MLEVFKMTEWQVLGLHFAKILRPARLDMPFMYSVVPHITCILHKHTKAWHASHYGVGHLFFLIEN